VLHGTIGNDSEREEIRRFQPERLEMGNCRLRNAPRAAEARISAENALDAGSGIEPLYGDLQSARADFPKLRETSIFPFLEALARR